MAKKEIKAIVCNLQNNIIVILNMIILKWCCQGVKSC